MEFGRVDRRTFLRATAVSALATKAAALPPPDPKTLTLKNPKDYTLRLARPGRARKHFRTALSLARSPMEKRFLEGRLRDCADV